MNRRLPLAIFCLLVVAGAAYFSRGWIRDTWADLRTPSVPKAVPYQPSAAEVELLGGSDGAAVEGGVSTSENYVLVTNGSAPIKADPLSNKKAMPAQVNLDVPFTMQAPTANWDYPYQEACEEASILMVDAFYDGKTGKLDPVEMTKAIDDLVDYQNRVLGYYRDTSVAETAQIAKVELGYDDIRTIPLTSMDQVRRAVANGYPVILPASGKALKNPNFRDGGPPYHMLVVKGYTADGKIITNDPGTRRGKDYVYDPVLLFNAVHDWNGGKVLEGKKLMMVIMPN